MFCTNYIFLHICSIQILDILTHLTYFTSFSEFQKCVLHASVTQKWFYVENLYKPYQKGIIFLGLKWTNVWYFLLHSIMELSNVFLYNIHIFIHICRIGYCSRDIQFQSCDVFKQFLILRAAPLLIVIVR